MKKCSVEFGDEVERMKSLLELYVIYMRKNIDDLCIFDDLLRPLIDLEGQRSYKQNSFIIVKDINFKIDVLKRL